jgi:hypothetical protein
MKTLYQAALQRDITKEELKTKIKNNDQTVLLKYLKKLEMAPLPPTATHEEILMKICEFLVTNEGKLMAAYSLSESTYQ